MSRLTAARRANLAPSQFAVKPAAGRPGAYPDEDKSHARDALAMVAKNGSAIEKGAVRHAVGIKYPGMVRSK